MAGVVDHCRGAFYLYWGGGGKLHRSLSRSISPYGGVGGKLGRSLLSISPLWWGWEDKLGRSLSRSILPLLHGKGVSLIDDCQGASHIMAGVGGKLGRSLSRSISPL